MLAFDRHPCQAHMCGARLLPLRVSSNIHHCNCKSNIGSSAPTQMAAHTHLSGSSGSDRTSLRTMMSQKRFCGLLRSMGPCSRSV